MRFTAVYYAFLLCAATATDSPVDDFDVGVALDQDEAGPVFEEGREGGVGDATLNGAEAPVVPGGVDVFRYRPAGETWSTQ